MIKSLIFILAVLISSLSIQGKAEINKDFQIKFGILERDQAGNLFVSEQTTNILFKLKTTGFRFGCEISPPDQSSYTYYTITHLPTPPKVVSGGFYDTNQIPTKDLVSKTARISQGIFFDKMFFDAGDPVGKYSVDIYINGKFVKTITFKVRQN